MTGFRWSLSLRGHFHPSFDINEWTKHGVSGQLSLSVSTKFGKIEEGPAVCNGSKVNENQLACEIASFNEALSLYTSPSETNWQRGRTSPELSNICNMFTRQKI